MLANALVVWPGGLDLWRWLHLAGGITTTLLAGVLAMVRARARRRHPIAGWRTVAAALLVTTSALVTGWIGGEVLVFHAGMAVKAGGGGALAPLVTGAPERPEDLFAAMRTLRSVWASAVNRSVTMFVHQPKPEELEGLADDARRIAALARWLASEGGRSLHEPSAPVDHQAAQPGAGHGAAGGAHSPRGPAASTRAEELERRALSLERLALDLERHARERDLGGSAQAVGEIGMLCAQCHERLRWTAGH